MSTSVKPQIELAHIPTAEIDIEDGHNPRGTVAHDADLKALAHTIETVGLLQTLRVRRKGDRYVVIAGERRYHAAILAGKDTVPAMIEPEIEDSEESRTARLLAAYVENHARVNFDPIAEANVFAALLQGGLTVAGIAEQIGGPKNTKQYRNARAHINEHLAMLTLPPSLYPQIADRAIPKKALPALVRLAEVMPALAELAAARVLSPPEGLDPTDGIAWDTLIASPVSICTRDFDGYGGELPTGVYEVGKEYDIAGLALTDQAREAQAEAIQIEGRDPFAPRLRFGKRDAEQARALNALACDDADSRAPQLIVGEDIAAQLVEQHYDEHLQMLRARAADANRVDPADDQSTGRSTNVATDSSTSDTSSQLQRDQQAAAQRKLQANQQAAERSAANAFNDRLGAAVHSELLSIRPDARALQILAAVGVGPRLDDIAFRGARYCLPGWIKETGSGAKARRSYLPDRRAAGDSAREFLASGTTPSQITGRVLSLVVMAVYADQRAVAESYRSHYEVTPKGMPWADETHDLIDALALNALGASVVGDVLHARRTKRDEKRAARQAKEQERIELDRRLADLSQASDDELATLQDMVAGVFGTWTKDGNTRCHAIRNEMEERSHRKDKNRIDRDQALRTVLDQIGAALSLEDLTAEQLDQAASIVAERHEESTPAIQAAIDNARQHLRESTTATALDKAA